MDLGSEESLTIRQEIFRATSELNDPLDHSVWWRWTAPGTAGGRYLQLQIYRFSQGTHWKIYAKCLMEDGSSRSEQSSSFSCDSGAIDMYRSDSAAYGESADLSLVPVRLGENRSIETAVELAQQEGAYDDAGSGELGEPRRIRNTSPATRAHFMRRCSGNGLRLMMAPFPLKPMVLAIL
ncbi:MAG: hypothetical protein R3F19_25600 [Verrucomicrobiales bacterium]